MVSQKDFAAAVDVTPQAVSKAIKVGRVPVYDETGLRVEPGYKGRKFIKLDEGSEAFRFSRARIDDSALADMARSLGAELDPEIAAAVPKAPAPASKDDAETLLTVKTAKEGLQSEILRLRLSRERGELVSRAAQMEAFETAGGKIARAIQSLPTWSEECAGVFQSGGLPALTAWLRAKANALCENIADLMSAPMDDEASDGDSDGPAS
jgi:hypothetical protein